MPMKASYSAILVRITLLLVIAACLGDTGCMPPPKPGAPVSGLAPPDAFAEAAVEAEPGEKRYLEAVKPALEAIAKNNWKGFYDALSTHAKAKMNTFQFDQIPKAGQTEPEQTVVTSPDEKAYTELVARFEAAYGKPKSIRHVYVDSTDRDVLSGKGDHIESLFAIGAMPQDVPFDIRRASIRAQFEREYKAEEVKVLAEELEISEDDVRAGKWPDDSDIEDHPYFNFKCVLVEENGQLRIGYFEFMPPSMLD
jgi:hypothetical protein